MRVWHNPDKVVADACASVSELQQAIDVLDAGDPVAYSLQQELKKVRAQARIALVEDRTTAFVGHARKRCHRSQEGGPPSRSRRPRRRSQAGPIGGGSEGRSSGSGPRAFQRVCVCGVGAVAASGRRFDSSQFAVQTCHLRRGESVCSLAEVNKVQAELKVSRREKDVLTHSLDGSRRRSPEAGQEVGRPRSGFGPGTTQTCGKFWHSHGSGTGACCGPLFDDGISDQRRWFSSNESLQSALMKRASCVRVVSARYGLRGIRVGEASHPGPSASHGSEVHPFRRRRVNRFEILSSDDDELVVPSTVPASSGPIRNNPQPASVPATVPASSGAVRGVLEVAALQTARRPGRLAIVSQDMPAIQRAASDYSARHQHGRSSPPCNRHPEGQRQRRHGRRRSSQRAGPWW